MAEKAKKTPGPSANLCLLIGIATLIFVVYAIYMTNTHWKIESKSLKGVGPPALVEDAGTDNKDLQEGGGLE